MNFPARRYPSRGVRILYGAVALAALFVPGAPLIPVAVGAPPDSQGGSDRVFNVREYGARGDGGHLDTTALNAAIAAAAQHAPAEVLVPAGHYVTGTVRLGSHLTLRLDAGARIIGSTNLNEYSQPHPPEFMPEAKWGKWHRALIVGENLEDITITGPGTIDGNRVFDPTGEEKMRGPHTIAFVNCRGFTIRDINIVDSANYAVFFQASNDVEVRNVKITGGWDGIHFRGAPEHDCRDVNIVGCRFYTGDDAIAGRYWDNVLISDCVLNSSCNGIRLIGPARHLIVNDSLFYGPGLRPHRTSGRTNMLSGVNLQPGGWDPTRGALDDVLLSNLTMRDVAAPITLSTRGANTVGRVTVSGLRATGVYRAPVSIESWSETPVANVVLEDLHIEFNGGGTLEQARQVVKRPGVDARLLPVWGIYARNVDMLTLADVRLSLRQDDLRPVLLAEKVKHLNLDGFRFTPVSGVAQPLVTNDVETVSFQPR